MDPLTRLNVMHLQETLPMPLDLTKQISEAVDLVKKKPSRSSRASRPHSICSSRSESGYESARVPLNTSLPNGFSHEPVKTLITVTENVQADDATINKTRPSRAGLDKREKNGAGPQDTPSVRPSLTLPLPEVETLSSECSGPGHTQYVSSDDSDVIEVPANISVSNDTSLRRRVSENEKWKKERMESSCLGMMEWDVLQDSDSMESRNVPSTSEAENADFCKATQNGSVTSSSSSSSHKRAPAGKKNRNQQHARPSAGKKATTSTAKRKKKKKKSSGLSSSSSAFPSNEAEIKLKYASCKEAKRDSRANTFAPYVRIELSACTVVNFEEDRDVQVRKQRRPMVSPGIVPATSCLQLGRLGSEGRSQTGELCCLCGWMANAAGLGDLHGPYHPCRPDRKTSVDPQINGHEDVGAKRKRKPDEVGEHWVHEDCSIWSAGVFLVKGRLYGLDEALRIAQKAVCSCCQRSGATLGCFFKGCPSKYHFPCALQAECVFNEENFTLRCPKHKNKLGLGVSRLQNR